MMPLVAHIPLKLIYNPSPSAPIGFYYLTRASSLKRGAVVLVPTPPGFRMMAAKRGYLPFNVPLLKQIKALSGDAVCRHGKRIFINQIPVVTALAKDNQGRNLPVWQGCLTLNENQFFALMDRPDSFDGRYFGPLNTNDIIGIAVPLVTWEANDVEVIASDKDTQNKE